MDDITFPIIVQHMKLQIKHEVEYLPGGKDYFVTLVLFVFILKFFVLFIKSALILSLFISCFIASMRIKP